MTFCIVMSVVVKDMLVRKRWERGEEGEWERERVEF